MEQCIGWKSVRQNIDANRQIWCQHCFWNRYLLHTSRWANYHGLYFWWLLFKTFRVKTRDNHLFLSKGEIVAEIRVVVHFVVRSFIGWLSEIKLVFFLLCILNEEREGYFIIYTTLSIYIVVMHIKINYVMNYRPKQQSHTHTNIHSHSLSYSSNRKKNQPQEKKNH